LTWIMFMRRREWTILFILIFSTSAWTQGAINNLQLRRKAMTYRVHLKTGLTMGSHSNFKKTIPTINLKSRDRRNTSLHLIHSK
jgi:hypothetical protein